MQISHYPMISLGFATFLIQLFSSLCCFMCLSFQSSCIDFAPINFSVYVSLFESVSPWKSSTAGWMSLMGLLVLDGKVTHSVSMQYAWKRGWLAKCENALWFGIYRTSRDCHHSSTFHHNPVNNHCWARAHHYSVPTENNQTLSATHQALGASGPPHQKFP